PGAPPPRLRRLVRDAELPPLPAAAHAAAPTGRRRLDGGAALPPGHRRAEHARPSATARLAKRRERLVETLLRREHAFEQVAVRANPLEHDVHRERSRVELLVHLVP